jgi:hypothetical protein
MELQPSFTSNIRWNNFQDSRQQNQVLI